MRPKGIIIGTPGAQLPVGADSLARSHISRVIVRDTGFCLPGFIFIPLSMMGGCQNRDAEDA